jgi:ATP/maltotriose-dependent transcriptional regulator MalT
MVERGKRDAEDYRLDFTLPFALVVETNARIGLRDFTEAAALLHKCGSLAARNKDVFVDMSTRTARCKMLVAHGAFDEALATTEGDWKRIPGPVVYGEFLGARALALACGNHHEMAVEAARRALDVTRGVEARTLAACARAIIAASTAPPDIPKVEEAFATAEHTENFDNLVAALRGAPALLEFGAAPKRHRELLTQILARSRDWRLARTVGLTLHLDPMTVSHDLSPREQEVFTLLLEGRTNRRIAEALYVSEATVKVHVRHILQKLGVRSRTEAVLKGSGAEH